MQKKVSIAIISVLFLGSLFWVVPALRSYSYSSQQRQLANTLGVALGNYRETDFPFQYFDQTLKPGMSIKDVHQIMRGYELTFKCQDWGEVYFYYSKDEKDAFKYMLLYDDDGKFESFITDDPYNSMGISTSGCAEGLLDD